MNANNFLHGKLFHLLSASVIVHPSFRKT